MGLIAATLVAAYAAGALLGGNLPRLAALRLRSWRLLAAAAAAQLVGALLGGPWYAVGLAFSAAAMVGFLTRNRRLPGVPLIAGGLLLNAVVVLANGAMPVSAAAGRTAGVDLSAVTGGSDPRHELSGPDTRLRWLGDVLPVPLPVRPEVASPGDAAVCGGLALFIVAGMRRAPVRYRPGLLGRGSPAQLRH